MNGWPKEKNHSQKQEVAYAYPSLVVCELGCYLTHCEIVQECEISNSMDGEEKYFFCGKTTVVRAVMMKTQVIQIHMMISLAHQMMIHLKVSE